ncbi:nuclear transport factor 2 family protein [Paracidovorax wautersii]|uniref:SnoaL-like domain-containing protein n=1 Tax=Paracidovorax wautersii TaxID=1177982 RepID=A0A1I2HAY4_9BURK|nr:nuclear transport factor 2 family protein [Paracidovorax wautersii]SFF26812.1 conserved hypothetical protein [Paracidovorax wautersii]
MTAEAPASGPDCAAAWQRLQAEQACRDLVLRSAALSDAGDAAALAALFAEDAQLVRPGAPPISGRAAIEQSYRQRPAGRITAHMVLGTLFDGAIGDGDEASATSRVLVWTADAGTEPGPHGRPAEPRQRLGFFADRFVYTAEGWRIQQRRAGFEMFRD